MDETCLKVNGKNIYVYSAVNAESKEIIYMKAFPSRNYFITPRFLIEVLRKCKNKPELVLIDKAPWLINAVKRLGLRYECRTFGKRNSVERVFGYLKDRSKIFYHNVNINFKKILKRMEDSLRFRRGTECVNEFLEMFVFYYSTLR